MSESFESTFPTVREIADDELRARVEEAWASALAESEFESLESVPWWPPHESVVGSLGLVEHVRAVTRCAVAIVDSLGEQLPAEGTVRRDVVIAGSILHDISKLFEISDGELVETHDLLPHPHYSVFLLADAGFSVHLQHVVLAHSDRSGVDPATIEAKIVALADEMVVDEIYWERQGRLKP